MKKLFTGKKKFLTLIFIFLFGIFIGIMGVNGDSNQKNLNTEQEPIDPNQSQPTKPQDNFISPTEFKSQTAPNNPNLQLAKVIRVIDGDTIEVDLGEGNIKTVRYIGIDTPESVDPRQGLQCYGKESTAKNKTLVENGIVGLEKDVSETDRYGRLLRYVYMGDLFVNQVLVAEGYAHATSYPPDVKYQEKLQEAEQKARAENKGLWKSCETEETPTPINSSTNSNVSETTTIGGSCKYSCSSPDRDCSDFSSHSEAQAFFNCCGFTAQNDPMRLDNTGVGDGIACENI